MNTRHSAAFTIAWLCVVFISAAAEPLSAQVRVPGGGTRPVPVPVPAPPGPVPVGGSTPTIGPVETIVRTPTPAPAAGVVPPVATAPSSLRLSCPVTSAREYTGDMCTNRLIRATTVLYELKTCYDAACYAARIVEISAAPDIVLTYPAEPQERIALQHAIRAELAYAVQYMGRHLRERALQGAPGLPDLGAIDNLIAEAKAEVNAIDQPIDETRDQRRQRLGLGRAKRRMAELVRRP